MLVKGQRVVLGGEAYRVARLNESRAVLVPVRKTVRKFYDRAGVLVCIPARGRPLSVSANSEFEYERCDPRSRDPR